MTAAVVRPIAHAVMVLAAVAALVVLGVTGEAEHTKRAQDCAKLGGTYQPVGFPREWVCDMTEQILPDTTDNGAFHLRLLGAGD